MLLRVIALYSVYLFVCQKVKISQGTELGLSQAIFSISSRRLEISFNGCENQSKEIHVLFAISESLLEYGTILANLVAFFVFSIKQCY